MEGGDPQLGRDIRKRRPELIAPLGERKNLENVTAQILQLFFQRLGEEFASPTTLYLLGGSALCLLGSPRETLDVDYALENPTQDAVAIIDQLAAELRLDLEAVPLEEFIPLPENFGTRRRFIDPKEFQQYFETLRKRARR